MENRWVNALVKTLILLIIFHILFLILGYLYGSTIGWFGLTMLWPHWDSWGYVVSAVIIGLVIYYVIYAFFTRKSASE